MSDIGNGRAGRADVVIVGGGSAGSAHKATVAIRARPSDIRDWQEHAVHDWTVEDGLRGRPGAEPSRRPGRPSA